MGSKQYKNKLCVYCGIANSDDGDHVVCRNFILSQYRNNLPKVPSCKKCNNAKSKLEHYLTTVLPFGWNNSHAGHMLERMVSPRLQKNAKLHQELFNGKQITYYSSNGSPWGHRMSLPFDGEKLLKLYAFITKGLAFHHWNICLTDEEMIRVGFFTREGEFIFEKLLAMNGQMVTGNFGGSAFTYQGVQSQETPTFSIWKMSLYGAELSELRNLRENRVTHAYAITAPKTMPSASKFVRLLNMK